MTIERTIHGYWSVSDLINGQIIRATYIGYTKREALQRFRQECRERDAQIICQQRA